jgi:four helix bundle protein
MNADELKKRTRTFGVRVIRMVDTLPPGRSVNVIANQLIRSATSVGANYRSACRGRSKPDFLSKLGIAIEEADESLYWLETLVEAELIPETKVVDLMKEANEITAILTATVKTTRRNMEKEKLHGKQIA